MMPFPGAGSHHDFMEANVTHKWVSTMQCLRVVTGICTSRLFRLFYHSSLICCCTSLKKKKKKGLSRCKPCLVTYQVISPCHMRCVVATFLCLQFRFPLLKKEARVASEHRRTNVGGMWQCFAFNHLGLISETRFLLSPLHCHVNLRTRHENPQNCLCKNNSIWCVYIIKFCMLITV